MGNSERKISLVKYKHNIKVNLKENVYNACLKDSTTSRLGEWGFFWKVGNKVWAL